MLAALAFLLGLPAGLWLRYSNARDRLDAASSQRLGREAEWTTVSLDLEAALAARAKAAKTESQLARISAIRAKPHWAPALRSLIPPVDMKIDTLEANARAERTDSGACNVRICGRATGPQTQMIADRYRQSVEENLKRNANGRPVSIRLDQLQQATGTLPDEKQSDFVMTTSIGSIEPAAAARKGGR